jgi:uncharacterized protein with HEPN domain
MKDDRLYLIHINECIERIESYVNEIDKDVFIGSTLIQDAVVRNLQILAESTQRLSEQLKAAHSEIDWYKIAGFRNILVHDYLGIDMETVWNIIEKEIPVLKKITNSMLE